MLDLLKATSILYGECTQTPPSANIYISDVLATAEQMEAITAKATELQGIYDSQEYARNRKAKYNLLNQDELRFDDLENTTTTWQDAINAIKLEYPK